MDDLIFDRTNDDVKNETDKGFYWYTDFNRIESWCQYLANKLAPYGYNVSITTKTDWTESNIPQYTDISRIRSNVLALKNAFYSLTSVPNVQLMTYQKANALEKVLYEIELFSTGMIEEARYSGTFYSGESEGLF